VGAASGWNSILDSVTKTIGGSGGADEIAEGLKEALRIGSENAVSESMANAGVTKQFQDINQQLAEMPFTDELAFDLDQYVTDKGLDGLFHMLALEEKKIRQDPAARVTDLLQKVFGDQP
jgi:hypothetical protein